MNHVESRIQVACVRWFRLQYPRLAKLLVAIPNGGARRKIEGAIMKAEGVTAGVSDLFLFFPSSKYHGLAVEMKTMVGRQQDTQKAWQREVEWAGYKYVLCRSFEQFQEEIRLYFSEKGEK
ncbi:MAG: VRR-NUC domain-containing protein [Bacteroidales bacterium]|nr:VRR-NUC domain-containing protein [Bacteroidales bacterium]